MRVPALERRSLLQELTLRGVRITGQRRILLETIQESFAHLPEEQRWQIIAFLQGRAGPPIRGQPASTPHSRAPHN
jgi:hypothetical protein